MSWQEFWTNFWESFKNFFLHAEAGDINNLTRIILAIIFAVGGHYLIKLILFLTKKAFGIKTKIQVDVSAKSFFISVLNVILNILLVVLILSTLNISLTSIATLFSAATVAIGLSLQNLISAFASGVVLLRVKHFKTGDYIMVVHSDGTCEGEVTQVSIISTSLKTFDNQVVIIPNNKLLEGVITNYTTQKSRRCVLKVNITYDSDLKLAKKVLYDLINSDERIEKDPVPFIHVSNLGEYSIEIAIKFYTINAVYWDVYNTFLEDVFDAFNKNNIDIAMRKIIVENKNIED